MREASHCAKKCEKRLVVRMCARNDLKCEYVRETAKSAIPHPPHSIVASVCKCSILSLEKEQPIVVCPVKPNNACHLIYVE